MCLCIPIMRARITYENVWLYLVYVFMHNMYLSIWTLYCGVSKIFYLDRSSLKPSYPLSMRRCVQPLQSLLFPRGSTRIVFKCRYPREALHKVINWINNIAIVIIMSYVSTGRFVRVSVYLSVGLSLYLSACVSVSALRSISVFCLCMYCLSVGHCMLAWCCPFETNDGLRHPWKTHRANYQKRIAH